MEKDILRQYQQFLKDSIRKTVDLSRTDQSREIAPPPIEKPYCKDAVRVDLPPFGDIGKIDLHSAIGNRESRRSYGPDPL